MRLEYAMPHVAELRTSYRQLFGTEAHGFQIRTAQRLLASTNVVLRAPTGSGKTNAALFPWLHARAQEQSFADRLIYALPVRTLASALYHDVKTRLGILDPGIRVTIQTGSDPHDSFFEGDVVFTTIDQLLSAYIGVPVSLPQKLANLPAGALIGAYVVFDEFHLMEGVRAFATALDLASRLESYTRVLFMTATYGEEPVAVVNARAKAHSERVEASELPHIPSQKGKQRRFVWNEAPLTAAAVLDEHRDRSIVVVNTVERAQNLYIDIKNQLDSRGMTDRLILLHARFLAEGRRSLEEEAIGHFKEGGTGHAILVATQVIEVGLDISAERLHTDLAPVSAIVQRAGRCARFKDEAGTVHVYELPRTDDGKRQYAPYLSEQKALTNETARCLEEVSGQIVDFDGESAMVDRVLSQYDVNDLQAIAPAERRLQVSKAIRSGGPHWVRDLIRQVDSVSIIVHNDPRLLRLDHAPELFSVDRRVVEGFLHRIDLLADPAPVTYPSFDEGETGTGVQWKPLRHNKDLGGTFTIAIRAQHAAYDDGVGLQLGKPGLFQSRETREGHDAAYDPYGYHREWYADHVSRVKSCHQRESPGYRVGQARLGSALGVPPEIVEHLALLAALMHDVGKLSVDWQVAMWNWQREVIGDPSSGFLAHSDYDPFDTMQRQSRKVARYRPPPHAAEGAYASIRTLQAAVASSEIGPPAQRDVLRALVSAITRHHGARTKTLSDFTLSPGTEAEVRRTLSHLTTRISLTDAPATRELSKYEEGLVDPERDALVYPLYWYVARRLRLADQRSLSERDTT